MTSLNHQSLYSTDHSSSNTWSEFGSEASEYFGANLIKAFNKFAKPLTGKELSDLKEPALQLLKNMEFNEAPQSIWRSGYNLLGSGKDLATGFAGEVYHNNPIALGYRAVTGEEVLQKSYLAEGAAQVYDNAHQFGCSLANPIDGVVSDVKQAHQYFEENQVTQKAYKTAYSIGWVGYTVFKPTLSSFIPFMSYDLKNQKKSADLFLVAADYGSRVLINEEEISAGSIADFFSDEVYQISQGAEVNEVIEMEGIELRLAAGAGLAIASYFIGTERTRKITGMARRAKAYADRLINGGLLTTLQRMGRGEGMPETPQEWIDFAGEIAQNVLAQRQRPGAKKPNSAKQHESLPSRSEKPSPSQALAPRKPESNLPARRTNNQNGNKDVETSLALPAAVAEDAEPYQIETNAESKTNDAYEQVEVTWKIFIDGSLGEAAGHQAGGFLVPYTERTKTSPEGSVDSLKWKIVSNTGNTIILNAKHGEKQYEATLNILDLEGNKLAASSYRVGQEVALITSIQGAAGPTQEHVRMVNLLNEFYQYCGIPQSMISYNGVNFSREIEDHERLLYAMIEQTKMSQRRLLYQGLGHEFVKVVASRHQSYTYGMPSAAVNGFWVENSHMSFTTGYKQKLLKLTIQRNQKEGIPLSLGDLPNDIQVIHRRIQNRTELPIKEKTLDANSQTFLEYILGLDNWNSLNPITKKEMQRFLLETSSDLFVIYDIAWPSDNNLSMGFISNPELLGWYRNVLFHRFEELRGINEKQTQGLQLRHSLEAMGIPFEHFPKLMIENSTKRFLKAYQTRSTEMSYEDWLNLTNKLGEEADTSLSVFRSNWRDAITRLEEDSELAAMARNSSIFKDAESESSDQFKLGLILTSLDLLASKPHTTPAQAIKALEKFTDEVIDNPNNPGEDNGISRELIDETIDILSSEFPKINELSTKEQDNFAENLAYLFLINQFNSTLMGFRFDYRQAVFSSLHDMASIRRLIGKVLRNSTGENEATEVSMHVAVSSLFQNKLSPKQTDEIVNAFNTLFKEAPQLEEEMHPTKLSTLESSKIKSLIRKYTKEFHPDRGNGHREQYLEIQKQINIIGKALRTHEITK